MLLKTLLNSNYKVRKEDIKLYKQYDNSVGGNNKANSRRLENNGRCESGSLWEVGLWHDLHLPVCE